MKFFGITYFNIKDTQSELFEKDPAELFLSPFHNMDEVEYWERKYTTRILHRSEDERYLAGCLFKSKDTHVISLEEKDFEETDILNWEKLYFIIDKERQLFVCQLKQSIVTPAAIRNRLQQLAEDYYEKSGYNLKLEFVKDEDSFWKLVKSTEKIFEISFSLNAPNLFGLRKEATGFLRYVKDKFNISSIDIGFNSENGSLSYDEEEMEPLRDYADSGGGKWTVKILEDGEKKTHKSDSYYKAEDVELEEDSEVSITENVEKAVGKLKQAIRLLRQNESDR